MTAPLKSQISVNYAAEIIALGFTIRPYPESDKRRECDFVDQHVTSYTVHQFRELNIILGKYKEDAELERNDPTFSRLTILYQPQNPRQVTEASKLRRGLQEYGITFNEIPNRGKLTSELERILDELKK